METSPFQSHHSLYQSSPYPPERRNDISTDVRYANEAGFTSPFSRSRPSHSLSYPPASGRSPRHAEFQPVRAQSRLQTGASPSAPSSILPLYPLHTQNSPRSLSLSSSSAFPLPYRPRSVAHYDSSPSEYSSPRIPLTSQDPHSYYLDSLPFQDKSSGRLIGFGNSCSPTISSANLPASRTSPSSTLDPGYSNSSQNWRSSDGNTRWPQSQSFSRRKYTAKWRRYESSPFNRRRLGSLHGFRPHPLPKNRLLYPTNSIEDNSQIGQRKMLLPAQFLHGEPPQVHNYRVSQRPRLARRRPLQNSFNEQKHFASASYSMPENFVSQYIPLSDDAEDNPVQPIRESKYWAEMKDDPIFFNLSNAQSKLVSIQELIKRRSRILQDHVYQPVLHQEAIMKEQGIQTKVDRRDSSSSNATANITDPDQRTEQNLYRQKFYNQSPSSALLSHSQQPPRIFNETLHENDTNNRPQTASLTDTDSSSVQTQPLFRMGGLKRSRSDTEDECSHKQSGKKRYHRRAANENAYGFW